MHFGLCQAGTFAQVKVQYCFTVPSRRPGRPHPANPPRPQAAATECPVSSRKLTGPVFRLVELQPAPVVLNPIGL